LVASVGPRGALAVILGVRLGVRLGVLSFVDFPKFLDIHSSCGPVVHIHNNKYLRISTFHHGVYCKSCMLVNLAYTWFASLLLGENYAELFSQFGLEHSASKTPSSVLPRSGPGSPVDSPPLHGRL